MARKSLDADACETADLSTKRGTSDLISYLVVRFILMMLAVMAVEAFVVWVESLALSALPGLLGLAWDGVPFGGTTSLFSLLTGLLSLLAEMIRTNYLQLIGAWRAFGVVVLLLVMLVMPMLPLLLGALAFARIVVRKVRALQHQREQELVRIDQQRSQFLTDIAHDLRTPLMAISGMAHAIDDGVVPNDETRDGYVRSIGEKADKLSGLVATVFDYTKLGSGAFSLDRKRIDLPQLLLREAAVAYTDVEDAGMTFSVHVSEDPCPVFADEVQFARVVSNLLVNAVRHNAAGAEIALALVRQAGIAYVVVADTGEPIAGDPSKLFEPFTRGDTARSASGGSGLGLSICKRIAQLHGYDLTLVQPYGRFSKAFVLTCTVL